jgi:hypothetical protein
LKFTATNDLKWLEKSVVLDEQKLEPKIFFSCPLDLAKVLAALLIWSLPRPSSGTVKMTR